MFLPIFPFLLPLRLELGIGMAELPQGAEVAMTLDDG